MAIASSDPNVPEAAPAAAAAGPVAPPAETRKKKKRKYSRGSRSIQELEMGTTRAAREISKAVARGFSVYQRRRNKSSRKRRDGALRDVVENVGKAMSRGFKAGSDAPSEFVKAISTRRFSKQVRDAVRIALPPLFR